MGHTLFWIICGTIFIFSPIQSSANTSGKNSFQYSAIAKIQMGTGVLLSKNQGLILTSSHVITDCYSSLGEANPWKPSRNVIGKFCANNVLKITFPMANGTPSFAGATIVGLGKADEIYKTLDDWVILQVDPGLLKTLPSTKLNRGDLKPGETIIFAGFPAEPIGTHIRDDFYASSGSIESKAEIQSLWDSVYRRLSLSHIQFSQLKDFVKKCFFKNSAVFFHNALIFPGYSGSPVYNAEGALSGVIFGTAGAWDHSFGPYPDSIGHDAKIPHKPANRFAAGILLKSICENNHFCDANRSMANP